MRMTVTYLNRFS